MSINSREKGRKGEIELAHRLRDYGYDARRGQQFCGIYGDPDVLGLPGIHIECKRVEKLNLYDAMAQSKRDARSNEMPCVFHRKNRSEWLVTMRFEDWMTLYGESDHLSRLQAPQSDSKAEADKIPDPKDKTANTGDKGAEA